MNAIVATHLGVERRRHQVALPNGDDSTGGLPRRDRRKDLDLRAGLLDPRRTDEHRVHGIGETVELDVTLERVDLTTEGIAPHRDVESAERLLAVDAAGDAVGQHDHPGAGAERRHTGADALCQRLEQVEGAGQLVHRGRLATGQHQCVAASQLLGAADRERRRSRDR